MTLINVPTTSVLKVFAKELKEGKGAIVLRTRILIIAHLPVWVPMCVMCSVAPGLQFSIRILSLACKMGWLSYVS